MPANGYFDDLLKPKTRRRNIEAACELLLPMVGEFDTIAFTGMSGACCAPIVAYMLDKKLLVVRKPKNEISTHSSHIVDGEKSLTRYIIVDDFSGSGNTARTIIDRITETEMAVNPLPLLLIEACRLYSPYARLKRTVVDPDTKKVTWEAA